MGSEKAFSSHRNDCAVPPVQFLRVLFLCPPGVGGIESLNPNSYGKMRKLEVALPFPQNGISSVPKVVCRTGVLNYYWVVDPFENVVKALESFPEKS